MNSSTHRDLQKRLNEDRIEYNKLKSQSIVQKDQHLPEDPVREEKLQQLKAEMDEIKKKLAPTSTHNPSSPGIIKMSDDSSPRGSKKNT